MKYYLLRNKHYSNRYLSHVPWAHDIRWAEGTERALRLSERDGWIHHLAEHLGAVAVEEEKV